MDMMEIRRKIIGTVFPSATEYTATGNPATFITDLSRPLKSLIAYFLPVQASGTPAPDNILPITGWTGVDVYHGADQTDYETYPVTWSSEGTVYGGYVDLITGEVWETWIKRLFTGAESETWTKYNTGGNTFFRYENNLPLPFDTSSVVTQNNKKCSHFEQAQVINSTTATGFTIYQYNGNVVLNFRPQNVSEMEVNDWKTFLSEQNTAETPVEIVYKIASPVLITTLTLQQINAIKGTNTIWSDVNGDCEVTYLNK